VTGLVDHPPSVTVIARVGKEVLVVRQLRPGAPHPLLELPAGTLEPGESVEEAAGRELREECGYSAHRFRVVASFRAAPAYSTELVHVAVAEGVWPDPRGRALDDDERIEVEYRPLADLPACLDDGVSIAAFALWSEAHRRRPDLHQPDTSSSPM
jgi:ADP-ribose pyrophosphatase